jgi:hypothetical protein
MRLTDLAVDTVVTSGDCIRLQCEPGGPELQVVGREGSSVSQQPMAVPAIVSTSTSLASCFSLQRKAGVE